MEQRPGSETLLSKALQTVFASLSPGFEVGFLDIPQYSGVLLHQVLNMNLHIGDTEWLLKHGPFTNPRKRPGVLILRQNLQKPHLLMKR